jgi:hypothetical protein
MAELEFTKKITKKGGAVFVGAVNEYQTEKGTLAVGFLADIAYLYADENNVTWSTGALVQFMKQADKKHDGDFPDGYEEYVELCTFEEDSHINPRLKDEFGITDEIETDIKAHLEQLSDYTKEVDASF